MESEERYPAKAYDRYPDDWSVRERAITQGDIPKELMHAVSFDLPWFSGPLTEQLPDGSDGPEFGALSVVWGSTVRDDGTRTVLGWYESGRGGR